MARRLRVRRRERGREMRLQTSAGDSPHGWARLRGWRVGGIARLWLLVVVDTVVEPADNIESGERIASVIKSQIRHEKRLERDRAARLSEHGR